MPHAMRNRIKKRGAAVRYPLKCFTVFFIIEMLRHFSPLFQVSGYRDSPHQNAARQPSIPSLPQPAGQYHVQGWGIFGFGTQTVFPYREHQDLYLPVFKIPDFTAGDIQAMYCLAQNKDQGDFHAFFRCIRQQALTMVSRKLQIFAFHVFISTFRTR